MVGDGKSLINLSYLYRKTMNDKGAAKELIDYFIKNVEIFMHSSEEAVEDKKFKELYKFAQKIETGAKHIYSDKIIDIASDIEFCSMERDFDRATTDLKILHQTIDDLIEFQDAM